MKRIFTIFLIISVGAVIYQQYRKAKDEYKPAKIKK